MTGVSERWQVGMTVLVDTVLGWQREARIYEAQITAVGRKWITIGHNRFNAETLLLDGGKYPSPGRVWASRSEFEAAQVRNQAWAELRQLLPFTAPDRITTERIRELIEELK